MKSMHRPLRTAAAVSAVLALAACNSGNIGNAEDFPSDDITVVVPYAAGGPSDTVSRAVAPFLEKELGQTVVVENKEGGSGALGMQQMMQEPADGHTLQLIASSAVAVTPQMEDVGYSIEDVNPVAGLSEYPYVLAVSNDSEYESAEDLFAAAKKNPGDIRIGSPGAASQGAVELQRLANHHDVQFSHVPFDGNSELNAALLGGNIDGIFLVASEDVLSLADSGEFRAVAIDAPQRVDYLDAPTITELGYDGIDMGVSYYGFGVHKDTPDEIRSQLEDVVLKALDDPEVAKKIGEEYLPQEPIDGAELKKMFTDQSNAYKPVVSELN